MTEQLTNNKCGGKTPFFPQQPEPHDIRISAVWTEAVLPRLAGQNKERQPPPLPCSTNPLGRASVEAVPPRALTSFCCLCWSSCAVLEGRGGRGLPDSSSPLRPQHTLGTFLEAP